MSHIRVTGTPPEPNIIAFYYRVADMFNNVILRTMYRAKNIRDNNNESQVDDWAISEDEKDFFNITIEKAIHDAFNTVMKMTTSVTDALLLNVLENTINTGSGSAEEKCYGFKVRDHEAYNANILNLVDDGIKNMVESYVMMEWYKTVGQNEELQKWLGEYMKNREILVTKRLFQLRKPFIS